MAAIQKKRGLPARQFNCPQAAYLLPAAPLTSPDPAASHVVVPRVDPALLKQALMCPALCDPILCDDNDLVRISYGGQPVGDGDGGPVSGEFLQALLDPALALIVQGAGGLVQDQDGRVLQEHAGN